VQAEATATNRDTAIAYGWTVHGALSSGDAAAPVIGSALLATPGMMDAFVFDGMAGQSVQADLFSSFDGRLTLAGPDGLMIAENDDFGGLTASEVSATLTQTGRHRVVVGTSPAGVGGDYSLTLRQEVTQASFSAPANRRVNESCPEARWQGLCCRGMRRCFQRARFGQQRISIGTVSRSTDSPVTPCWWR